MLEQGVSFIKTLIKSSLDSYVLPGTLTGTEIMLLYMSQWRRNVAVVAITALYLLSSEMQRSKLLIPPSNQEDDSTTHP